MRPRPTAIALLALAGLATPTLAMASPTCTAYPARLPRLEDCMRQIDPGGTITLRPGVHEIRNLTIDQPVTLLGTGDDTVLAHDRSWISDFLDLLENIFNFNATYLVDTASLLEITAPGGRVRIENVDVRPPTAGSAYGDTVVGRAVVAIDAEVELVDVRLVPWIDGSSGPDPLLVYPEPPDAASADTIDRSGGVLASAALGSRLVLEDCTITGLDARQLVGAVVFAEDAGTEVHILEGTRFEGVESLAGAIAALDSARIVVDGSGSAQPLFAGLTAPFGGALHASRLATIDIRSGVFDDNGLRAQALETAGGHILATEGSEVAISGGTFQDGRATMGGAVAVFDGPLQITGGTFQTGTAREGGLLYVAETAEFGAGQVSLSGITLEDGRLRPDGGDDTWGSDGLPEPEDVTVLGAGAAFWEVPVTIDGVTFSGNGALGTPGMGGGLAVVGGPGLTLMNTRFEGNQARFGAGLVVAGTTADIRGGHFRDNGTRAVTEAGGGIFAYEADLDIRDARLDRNQVGLGNSEDLGSGGGIACVGSRAGCQLVRVDMSGNSARTGGGLWAVAPSITVQGGSWESNTAIGNGGHVWVGAAEVEDVDVRPDLRIDGTLLRRGAANWGGAVYATAPGLLTIRDATLENNEATGFGGALAVKDTTAVLERLALMDNDATEQGGGVYAVNSSFTLDDSWISGNTAALGGGVALVGYGDWSLDRSVWCGNQGSVGGSMLLAGPTEEGDPSPVSIRNNLVDGQALTQAAVAVERKAVSLAHNNLVRTEVAPLAVGQGARVEARRNLFGFHETSPMVVVQQGGDLLLEENAWWGGDGPAEGNLVRNDGTGDADPPSSAILVDPELWGNTEGRSLSPQCEPLDHRPRPLSPLLLDGWPAAYEDAIVGLYGGPDAARELWTTDTDVDRTSWVFDCDDEDDLVGPWRELYEDLDGDGVGGAPLADDLCTSPEGYVEVGGDCDDQDPDRTADCAATWAFYGQTCQTVPGGATLPGLVLLGLLGLRRRR